ncbi:xanthine dehydrogenase accessory protein XdhC [Mesorhizobium sp. CN2-181]|uniref:xanthine dehydrogenase accessory protein XdhC n=1 Tax=Mesorhizobium yinganensis TaxID=3157707 RepID=UPI0032B8588E
MASIAKELRAFLDGPATALVEVASAKGSTPREKGAWMLVSKTAIFGTIGGGQLEYMAIDKARMMLRGGFSPLERGEERSAEGREKANDLAFSTTSARSNIEGPKPKATEGVAAAVRRPASSTSQEEIPSTAAMTPPPAFGRTLPSRGRETLLSIPLGPEIGQCCGGRVDVSIRQVDAELKADLLATVETEEARLPHVYVFGGGHVGQALAAAFSLLPLRMIVVESRAEALEGMPSGIETRLTAMPEAAVRDAPVGSAFVVLTHDHALDFLIVAEALGRDDAAYVGMIGSKTKKATFRNWYFKTAGGTDSAFARLVSPIGGDAVKDKRPAVIAALAVAEIMTVMAKASMDGGAVTETRLQNS